MNNRRDLHQRQTEWTEEWTARQVHKHLNAWADKPDKQESRKYRKSFMQMTDYGVLVSSNLLTLWYFVLTF